MGAGCCRSNRRNRSTTATSAECSSTNEHDVESPIESATFIRLEGKALTDDLSDDEMEGVLSSLPEALAFCGIAASEYFRHGNYFNRDTFSSVVQLFTPGQSGVSVRVRRRDGGIQNFFQHGTFQVIKEWHVYLLESFSARR